MQLRTIAGVVVLLLAATTPATAAMASSTTAAAVPAVQDTDCSFPVERTDATGTTVTVESEPTRVVTLNPSAAQTLWEMGAQDKVVGVTKWAMNLEGAEAKTNISGAGRTVNNEEVVGLQPDLVLAPNTIANDTVTKLRETGLTVYRFREAKSIGNIYRKTRIIGELTGECAAAEETVEWMQSELAVVDRATAETDRPDIVYAFYGYTAGNGTFIHKLMERAGTNNVAADAGIESYQPINDEILLEQDPDWILLNSDWDEVPGTAAYNGTTAIQEGQTVVVNKNWLNRPAPRVVLAVRKLAKTIHPEAYAAVNATATVTETEAGGTTETETATDDESTPTDSEPTPVATTTSGETGSGFTALGAVGAFICLSLLASYRRD